MKNCVVGKVLTTKPVNRDGFRRNMKNIWVTSGGMSIESLGTNQFIFHFVHEEDKRRILTGGPWHYDNALILTVEPKGVGEISKIEFRKATFWVQFHNIPILCMNKATALFLGNMIGKVKDIDTGDDGDCLGNFMRVRVEIDVTKPLERCSNVELFEGEEVTVLLKYERLPDYCFDCGLLGHTDKECPSEDPNREFSFKTKAKYADWLKAPLPVKFKKPGDQQHEQNQRKTRNSESVPHPNRPDPFSSPQNSVPSPPMDSQFKQSDNTAPVPQAKHQSVTINDSNDRETQNKNTPFPSQL